jgi:hypothetical protein
VLGMLTSVLGVLLTAPLMAPPSQAESQADPPLSSSMEINYLIGYLGGSHCSFYRNGTWHDSRAAQEHLLERYGELALNGWVDTAEQFIDQAASRSKLTEELDLVRCPGGQATPTSAWLQDALARLRKT